MNRVYKSISYAVRLRTWLLFAMFISLATPVSAQENFVDFAGKGKNLAFTLVHVTPTFWINNYEVLRKRQPELYVRRVITDQGDDYLMVAMLNDTDIVEFLGAMIYEIDKLGEIAGSNTWLGSVDIATKPLTIKDFPRTGFFIAKANSTGVARMNALGTLIEKLRGLPEVLLAATTSRDGDLIVVYDLKTRDIAGHNAFMAQVRDALGDSMVMRHSGECPPVAGGD